MILTERDKIELNRVISELKDDNDRAVSLNAVLDILNDFSNRPVQTVKGLIAELPSVTPKKGHCKDCKWWKDKDGVYRRGIGAESKCPINRREVMEGMGYCFMFEHRKGANE